ncbi:hypothetical protein Lal_00021983 [Lupinus albus]|nr:hypothetical protein Lal_00021983 [Lupinus albus]
MRKNPKVGGGGVEAKKLPNTNTNTNTNAHQDLPYVILNRICGIDLPYMVMIRLYSIDLPYVVFNHLRGIDLPYVGTIWIFTSIPHVIAFHLSKIIEYLEGKFAATTSTVDEFEAQFVKDPNLEQLKGLLIAVDKCGFVNKKMKIENK